MSNHALLHVGRDAVDGVHERGDSRLPFGVVEQFEHFRIGELGRARATGSGHDDDTLHEQTV